MIIYQWVRVRERICYLAYETFIVRGRVLEESLYIRFRVCESEWKFTSIQAWPISSVLTLCVFGSLLESQTVLGNARARASERVDHCECLTLMHSCPDPGDVLPRNCCLTQQTLMHICPDNAVYMSNQYNTYPQDAAVQVHSCYTFGSPVRLERCPVAITQVPDALCSCHDVRGNLKCR
jgi:hypothetical protein